MLDPSWLRKVLGEFLLRDSERRGVTGEHDGAHARGAAVEGENGRVGLLHGDAQETQTFESSSILLSLTRFGSCKIMPTQSSSRPGIRATPFGRGYAAVRRAPWRCVPCGRTIAHERVDEIHEHRAARKRRRQLRDSRKQSLPLARALNPSDPGLMLRWHRLACAGENAPSALGAR